METLKEIIKNTLEGRKLYDQKKDAEIKGINTYEKIQRMRAEGKTDEEIKKIVDSDEWRAKQDEEIKQHAELLEDIKINNLQAQLLNNKWLKEFLQANDKNIIETLKKYENKNIGEKTKEKLQNELKELVKNYIKRPEAEIYIHFSFANYYESEKASLHFEIREQDKQERYIYKLSFGYKFYIYNNQYTDGEEKSYIVSFDNCWNFYSSKDGYNFTQEDTSKANVKKLLNESKKQKLKVDKLLKQAAEIRHQLGEFVDSYGLEVHDSEDLKQPYEVRLY